MARTAGEVVGMWWWGMAAQAGLGDVPTSVAARMVDEVGPRVAGTPAGDRAQMWVVQEIEKRGWRAELLAHGVWSTPYTCRAGVSSRVVLFLAHTDSVHADVPGANDNAAAVAVLLSAMNQKIPRVPPRTVCFAFPDAEEMGLLGSTGFAEIVVKQGVLGSAIDQVVALDLVGHGVLTHNGLGQAWDAQRLRALLAAAPAEVPWVYRGISWALPHMERSDHAPFAALDVPSSHLMARGASGVYWAYHSRSDTVDQLEARTIGKAVLLVRSIARAPLLPARRGPDPAVVAPGGFVLPGGVLWTAQGLGVAGGALALGRMDRTAWAPLGHSAFAALAFTATVGLAGAGRPMHAALTGPVCAAGLLAWAAAVLAWPWPASVRGGQAVAGAFAVSSGALAYAMGPIFGAPAAVAGLGALLVRGKRRWLPAGLVFASWPFAFFVRPAALRELAFHGLWPATAWAWGALVLVLGLPLVASVQGRVLPRHRGAALVVGLLAVVAIAMAWAAPTYSTDYPALERRSP